MPELFKSEKELEVVELKELITRGPLREDGKKAKKANKAKAEGSEGWQNSLRVVKKIL